MGSGSAGDELGSRRNAKCSLCAGLAARLWSRRGRLAYFVVWGSLYGTLGGWWRFIDVHRDVGGRCWRGVEPEPLEGAVGSHEVAVRAKTDSSASGKLLVVFVERFNVDELSFGCGEVRVAVEVIDNATLDLVRDDQSGRVVGFHVLPGIGSDLSTGCCSIAPNVLVRGRGILGLLIFELLVAAAAAARVLVGLAAVITVALAALANLMATPTGFAAVFAARGATGRVLNPKVDIRVAEVAEGLLIGKELPELLSNDELWDTRRSESEGLAFEESVLGCACVREALLAVSFGGVSWESETTVGVALRFLDEVLMLLPGLRGAVSVVFAVASSAGVGTFE